MHVCKHVQLCTHDDTEVCQPVSGPKSPSPKPALFCGNPKAPVRLLTPKWHAAPVPSRDLVSIDFDDFPFQGRLGKDPKQPRSNGAFMLYSGIRSVRCRNGPVRVISVSARTPDPPISITPPPTPVGFYGVIICNMYSYFC